jgi:hypothetical protein
MDRRSKKDNAGAFRSQLSPLLALVDTPKLYRIKKIVRLENNIITLDNAIDVESTNSSNNEDNSAPLLNKGDGAKNNFVDYKNKGDISNPNTIFFFKYIYVYISLIYLI